MQTGMGAGTGAGQTENEGRPSTSNSWHGSWHEHQQQVQDAGARARARADVEDKFIKHVMCNYTPRAPGELQMKLWASVRQLQPTQLQPLLPDHVKQLITNQFKDHRTPLLLATRLIHGASCSRTLTRRLAEEGSMP